MPLWSLAGATMPPLRLPAVCLRFLVPCACQTDETYFGFSGIGGSRLTSSATLRQAPIRSDTIRSSTSRTLSYSVRFRMSWHVREAVTDDHQVDIARRLVGRLGNRTVHERRTNRLR